MQPTERTYLHEVLQHCKSGPGTISSGRAAAGTVQWATEQRLVVQPIRAETRAAVVIIVIDVAPIQWLAAGVTRRGIDMGAGWLGW